VHIVNQDGQVLNPISNQKQLKTMASGEAHSYMHIPPRGKAKDNTLAAYSCMMLCNCVMSLKNHKLDQREFDLARLTDWYKFPK